MHISSQIKLHHVVDGGRFNPNTLPDTAAGCVENVRRIQRLLPNGNHVIAAVSRVVNKYEAAD